MRSLTKAQGSASIKWLLLFCVVACLVLYCFFQAPPAEKKNPHLSLSKKINSSQNSKQKETVEKVFVEELKREIFSDTRVIRENNAPINDPVISEVVVTDHNETDNNEDFQPAKSSENMMSDKPFDSMNLNDAIGVGGGGGRMGARFGGRRAVPARKGALRGSDYTGNTEEYRHYGINPITETNKDKLSTFATDVDTGSYTIARRKITSGSIPPSASIRVEEFINYFSTGYEKNKKECFKVHLEAAPSPFRKKCHLMKVVVQGKEVSSAERKPANLVFLIDVSGSMRSSDKLSLVVKSLKILTESLDARDSVAICTYAGGVRIALEPTSADNKEKIFSAFLKLRAGGSTAMASGIQNAYSLANVNFQKGAVNRVIICSDGDANVGNRSHQEILTMIEDYKEKGITLSTVGFGMGNYKDVMMEQLANKGNGNYTFIDNLSEAKRVFSEELTGTLQVIAKDMKVQVEFNADVVKTYRLIGYENREVKDKDFRNDKVDGGEVGAGHTVTALYELELTEKKKGSLCNVFVRAKQPDGIKAEELKFTLNRETIHPLWENTSQKFKFIACVSEFAEILRESPYATSTMEAVLEQLVSVYQNKNKREQEFLRMVQKTIRLKG